MADGLHSMWTRNFALYGTFMCSDAKAEGSSIALKGGGPAKRPGKRCKGFGSINPRFVGVGQRLYQLVSSICDLQHSGEGTAHSPFFRALYAGYSGVEGSGS